MFEPGLRYEYSNAGYIVLGAIIESVTGKNYFDYVKENIYLPADMPNTDSYDLEFDVSNLAIGYTCDGIEDERRCKNNLFLHVVKGGPAGGGYSTVEDLLNFDIAIRNRKLLNTEWTELVSYGFLDIAVNGERIIGHHRSFPGVSTALNMYMNSGYTLVVLSNYDNAVIRVLQKFDELFKIY